MTIPSKAIALGVGSALALGISATLISLQVATFNVATNAAERAVTESYQSEPERNERVADRVQALSVGGSFFAVSANQHDLAYDTVSMTYRAADGSPVTEGGFDLIQDPTGLLVEVREGTPEGDYRVVISDLAPSEIDHDLVFFITVTLPVSN